MLVFSIFINDENTIVAAGIAARTKTEFINNKVTGNLDGEPIFAEGKLSAMQQWSDENDFQLNEAIFYTDSINDLPLVKACKHSIIISPDKELERYAKKNSLEIIYR